MRYVTARYNEKQRELAYRIYVTDALKAFGGLNRRYYDVIDVKPQETRTAEEITDNIRHKLTALGGE